MYDYNCGGTMGDTYVILCKLYNEAIENKIKVHHYTGQSQLNPLVEEVYSLLPNISIDWSDSPFKSTLCGHLEDNHICQWEKEGVYNYTINYFPEFDFGGTEKKMPKSYQVLQVKSGRKGQDRTIPKQIVNDIKKDKFTVIVGTDNLYGNLSNKDTLDLRGKTTFKEAMQIVKDADYFYGFIGIMTYVATSNKVNSDVYVTKRFDGSELRLNNEWGNYCKVKRL